MATVEDTAPRDATADDFSHLQSRQQPPPKSDGSPRGTAKTEPKVTPRSAAGRRTAADKLEAKLTEFIGTAGMVVSMFNQTDGFIILSNAEPLAQNWTALAEENAAVKRVLNSMVETGAWSAALMATAAVALPIMDNHGYIPDRFRPFVPSAPSAGRSADSME